MARTSSRVVAVAMAAMLAGSAGTAFAQAGWGQSADSVSAPQSTGGAIGTPKVDVDAAGNAIALWTEPLQEPPWGTALRTARFDAAARRWGPPYTLQRPSSSSLDARQGSAREFDLAVDTAGNALAIWTASAGIFPTRLRAARYEAAGIRWSGWSSQDPVAAHEYSARPRVALNANGDAVQCWVDWHVQGVFCRRYAASLDTWTATERIGGTAETPALLDLALDAAGNIHVVWPVGIGTVQTARYSAATAAWTSVSDLATGLPGPGQPGPQVAMNEAGDAVATWSRGGVLEAARYPAGGTGWTMATPLSVDGTANDAARAAVDPAGVITVAWVHTTATARTIQVSRYDPVTAAWTPAADLPGQGTSAYGPAGIDADALGNVHVVWSQSLVSPQIRLLASRYAVSTGQWTTVTNLSALGQSAFNSDVAVDASGSAMAIWFQTAGGLSAPQTLRWEATPAAPSITAVTPSSATLSIAVSLPASVDPALASTNLEYSLDGGTTWTTRAPASVSSPLTVAGLTDGVTYALQLRTVNAAGAGRSTATAAMRSGTGTSPTDLRVVTRTGNLVTLAWVAPAAGLVPTGYLLEGGIAGQTQVLASIPTGGAATQITLAIPAGTFFVRIVATAGAVRLGATPDLQLAVESQPVPASPVNLLGSANGSSLALSWTNAWTGGVPTSLQLQVSGAINATLPLPVTESFTFPTVPAGTYTFSVSALNGGVLGAGSSPVTLTFAGTCGTVPNPPAAFSASTQGGVVYLDWLPPATGEAVTGYVVSVTGAFTGSFPMAARTLAVPVPPGSYTVSVAAVGPCGTSTPTPAQTAVVQ